MKSSIDRIRMMRFTFLHLVLLAGSIYLLGIAFLIFLAQTNRMTDNLAVAIGQIWTEVVGFSFAGASLYLAWRATQEPDLTISLDPDSNATVGRFKTMSVKDGVVTHISLYLRNNSSVSAQEPKVELTTYPEAILLQVRPVDPDFAPWEGFLEPPGGIRRLVWKPEGGYLAGKSSLFLGTIIRPNSVDFPRSFALLCSSWAANARRRYDVLTIHSPEATLSDQTAKGIPVGDDR